MTNYKVGDFLIRLKNAAMANIKELAFPNSKIILGIANTLKEERFLDSIEIKEKNLIVKLAIYKKKPVLSNITIISRPGLRIYMGADEIGKIKKPDIYILSTPKGIMSGKKAIKQRLGGEVIAKVI